MSARKSRRLHVEDIVSPYTYRGCVLSMWGGGPFSPYRRSFFYLCGGLFRFAPHYKNVRGRP